MGRIHVGVTVPRGVNGSGWIRSGSQFRVPRPYYLSRAPNAPTAFVLRSEEFPSRSHFPRCVSSLWSFPRGEQTLMEPSNLSALKEEEEEEDETSVGGGDQVRRAAPSAFSPDSIPPRPASQWDYLSGYIHFLTLFYPNHLDAAVVRSNVFWGNLEPRNLFWLVTFRTLNPSCLRFRSFVSCCSVGWEISGDKRCTWSYGIWLIASFDTIFHGGLCVCSSKMLDQEAS